MQRYQVTWRDGATRIVEAADGTAAKAHARVARGVKKSEIPIARCVPLPDAAPTPAAPAVATTPEVPS